ncbi:MAG: penicillin acylase family protein [Anaerolineae bacterium]|nr:penicillin acylase family protein [Anaerolineae bacterium]MBL8106723.1 penicillin acylase family protein [Anaerolineales bacterium]MCC7187102.1 penicillin acylase family protein [Anaerolineales bacterium]
MSKTKTILKRAGLGALILAVLLAGGGGFYFKSYLPNTVAPKSFPQIDGEIQLEGLDGPVDVYRDSVGIPHIYATTQHDLFFAQGYIHAQDRFWQMDFWRHVGSGRIAEMFPSQADTDAFLRTLGWRVTAEQEYELLDAESKALVNAYTAGVNSYIEGKDAVDLSLEYALLGLPILAPDYKIEPWTPVHSLTWGKAMAWDLRGNMGEEIERAVLMKTLTPEQVAELFPEYPSDHPVIVNKIGGETVARNATPAAAFNIPDDVLATLQNNVSLLDVALGPLGDGVGSNSWAVSGSLTSTGEPFLANDPHLGIQMPSIWYQVHLECRPVSDACPYNVAGFSFPGVPGVVIGHNEQIAWGFTNVGPDVMDLYIERVNPENPNQYEVNGEWVDFETREEIIHVAGGEPISHTVRLTRHGPVISDDYGPLKDKGEAGDEEFVPFKDRAGVDLPEQYVIALQWTALAPSTPFKAIWGFDKAKNWDEFREAAKDFHVPPQNLIYADVNGNIAYQMPGDIPIRAKGDGTLPVPGWTDEYEWTGYLPFEELPYTVNPDEGYIVTANNRVPPFDYPNWITYDWDYGFRAQRIVDMIQDAPGKIDIAYIQQMQGDSFDAVAAQYVPILLETEGLSEKHASLLTGWDYQDSIDSSAAAMFNAFWRRMLKNTFNDEMPEERYYPDGGSRWNEVMRHMDESSRWWDDTSTTEVVETREEIIKKSFAEGVSELEEKFGSDTSKWKWGDMHASTFRNGTLGESGIGLIEDLFNRGPFPTGGGEAIVNATGWSVRDGYETNWLPSMRMIVDLGVLSNSVTVHTTGQSGHAYHPHYIDLAPLWANIEYYPMLWEHSAIIADTEGHLVLTPK